MDLKPTLYPFLDKTLSFEDAEYVLFAAPLDKTTSNRRGARFAPLKMRLESAHLDTYSTRTGLDWNDLKLSDLGDITCPDLETSLSRIEETINSIKPKFPVMLGGEHTITLGALRALKSDLVIIFDAHLDLRDELFGEKKCHATYLRRGIEELGFNAIILGARALSGKEVKYAESNERVSVILAQEIIKDGIEKQIRSINEVLDSAKSVYLSIDMDVLDPSYAPGVGNPHPEGLSTVQLMDIIASVMSKKFEGFDITEVYPHYDTGITVITACYLVMETIYAHLAC
jgi:agmatinase